MELKIDTSKIRIITNRILLRGFMQSDLDDFYEYAKIEGVGEMAGWPYHKSIEESQIILDNFINNKNVLAVVDKKSNKVIGSFGFNNSWANNDEKFKDLMSVDIGYVLSKDYWGKGLMSEIVSEVLNYLFKNYDLDIITCSHFKENTRSKRVIEKSGFTYYKDSKHYSKLLNKELESLNYILLKDANF